MGKRFAGIIIISAVLLSSAACAVNGDMGVGTDPNTNGSAAYPWLIEDLADFDAFAGDSAYWAAGVHTKLMTDIDLAGRTYTKAVIAPNTGTSYIFPGSMYSGILDGNGYAVYNLTIAGSYFHLGLIGKSATESIIHDVQIIDANISSSNEHIGILVGCNSGLVMRSYATGQVAGYCYCGGLVGQNAQGRIMNCHTNVTITADDCGGGLVGDNNRGVIVYCHSTGRTQGEQGIGGLVGSNRDGFISNCYSAAEVGNAGSSYEVGGLVGSHNGVIMSCYAMGYVAGYSAAGGLLGYNNRGIVSHCYANANVTAVQQAGGLVGNNAGTLAACYSVGQVNATTQVGGLAGQGSQGTAIVCFWDRETSLQETSSGGVALTTEQMTDVNSFLNAGWDFVDENTNGTNNFWTGSSGDYPQLAAFNGYQPPVLSGYGTEADPYLIHDVNELGAIQWYDPVCHYRLSNNLDLAGVNWIAAPIQYLTGSFDGGCHSILNLTIDGGSRIGLIGQLNWPGQVKKLTIKNAVISGNDTIGGIVGWNYGTIAGCHVNGTIGGVNYIGGLCGRNYANITDCHATIETNTTGAAVGGLCGYSDGNIVNCYTAGKISGDFRVGGLCGDNYEGTITSCYVDCEVTGLTSYVGGLCGAFTHSNLTSCYASGMVIANSNVGGLCGDSYDSNFTNCYSACDVTGKYGYAGGLCGQISYSTLTNCCAIGAIHGSYFGGLIGYSYSSSSSLSACFWDTVISQTTDGVRNKAPDPAGAIGKTTAQMQTQSTFVGWDFSESDGDGADWMMLREGEDYPRLAWQEVFAGDIAGLYGVDLVDLAEIARNWLEVCPGDCEDADIDDSGAVDVGDVVTVADEWLKEY